MDARWPRLGQQLAFWSKPEKHLLFGCTKNEVKTLARRLRCAFDWKDKDFPLFCRLLRNPTRLGGRSVCSVGKHFLTVARLCAAVLVDRIFRLFVIATRLGGIN